MASDALTGDSVLRLGDQVSLQGLGDDEGGVLLRLDTGDLYTVNDTAFAFVSNLDGARSIGGAAEVLARDYDVPIETLVSDLIEVASELVSESLLTTA